MARPKIIGNEKCPYPECGELGRVRRKAARNRPTSPYVYRYWFSHNDSNIREHYIDNFVRPKEYEKNPGLKISEEYLKIGHSIDKISKRIMSFPLNLEESKSLNLRLKWFKGNILAPLDIIADITTGRLKVPPGTKKALWEMVTENILSEYNVFGRGYEYLYKKYDRPMRLERNRIRNTKLSEWHGRRTNDFTGIIPESFNPELKP